MDAFAHIRTLIEESEYQQALEAMKPLTTEREQLDQLSVLSRESKEIKSREIANLTTYENLRQEYNALSYRMLAFLSQLEHEAEVAAKEKTAQEAAKNLAKAKPVASPSSATAAKQINKPSWWSSLVGLVLVLLVGWGLAQAIRGESEVPPKPSPEPRSPKEVVTTDPEPKTATSPPASKLIYESLVGDIPIIPGTKYVAEGAPVDILIGVYTGRPNDVSTTKYSSDLSDLVAKSIRAKTTRSVSTSALTQAFHQSADRREWTTSRRPVLSQLSDRAKFLVLADWRTDEGNAKTLAYSIHDLERKKPISNRRISNKPGDALSVKLVETLSDAVTAAVNQ